MRNTARRRRRRGRLNHAAHVMVCMLAGPCLFVCPHTVMHMQTVETLTLEIKTPGPEQTTSTEVSTRLDR